MSPSRPLISPPATTPESPSPTTCKATFHTASVSLPDEGCKEEVKCLFDTKIGDEAVAHLVHMSAKFDEANNCTYSKDKSGDGSLCLGEVAFFVRSMTTGAERHSVGIDAFQDRLAPIVSKWDLDGNGTMELHELITMMLCDETYAVEITSNARSQLLQLMAAEVPGGLERQGGRLWVL